MTVAAVVFTVLLLLEVVPSAIAQLLRSRPGIDRLDELTRLGLRDGRNQAVVPLLGVLHTIGTAGLIAGLSVPVLGVGAAVLELGIFCWVLLRQLRCGDRGRALFAYSLFATLALAVLIIDAVRW